VKAPNNNGGGKKRISQEERYVGAKWTPEAFCDTHCGMVGRIFWREATFEYHSIKEKRTGAKHKTPGVRVLKK